MAESPVSHLIIDAYTEPKMTGDPVKSYTVRVNPEHYSRSYKVLYSQKGGMGDANAVVRFNQVPPGRMSFQVLFDSTGAIEGSPTSLDDEIQGFLDTIYRFQGGIHQPYYLKVRWGNLTFPARVTDVSMEYTLFSATGEPLRARATLQLVNSVDLDTLRKLENTNSPDVTHRFEVRAGEKLPGLSQRVYGTPHRYPDLARANRLVNFRALRPGSTVICPPLARPQRP